MQSIHLTQEKNHKNEVLESILTTVDHHCEETLNRMNGKYESTAPTNNTHHDCNSSIFLSMIEDPSYGSTLHDSSASSSFSQLSFQPFMIASSINDDDSLLMTHSSLDNITLEKQDEEDERNKIQNIHMNHLQDSYSRFITNETDTSLESQEESWLLIQQDRTIDDNSYLMNKSLLRVGNYLLQKDQLQEEHVKEVTLQGDDIGNEEDDNHHQPQQHDTDKMMEQTETPSNRNSWYANLHSNRDWDEFRQHAILHFFDAEMSQYLRDHHRHNDIREENDKFINMFLKGLSESERLQIEFQMAQMIENEEECLPEMQQQRGKKKSQNTLSWMSNHYIGEIFVVSTVAFIGFNLLMKSLKRR